MTESPKSRRRSTTGGDGSSSKKKNRGETTTELDAEGRKAVLRNLKQGNVRRGLEQGIRLTGREAGKAVLPVVGAATILSQPACGILGGGGGGGGNPTPVVEPVYDWTKTYSGVEVANLLASKYTSYFGQECYLSPRDDDNMVVLGAQGNTFSANSAIIDETRGVYMFFIYETDSNVEKGFSPMYEQALKATRENNVFQQTLGLDFPVVYLGSEFRDKRKGSDGKTNLERLLLQGNPLNPDSLNRYDLAPTQNKDENDVPCPTLYKTPSDLIMVPGGVSENRPLPKAVREQLGIPKNYEGKIMLCDVDKRKNRRYCQGV